MNNKLYDSLIIALACLLTACSSDELTPREQYMSCLRFALCEQGEVITRATPAELEKPLAEQFTLHVQNKKTGRVIYNGAFLSEVEAGNGTYTITATYGEDALLEVDKPYFKGEAEAVLDAENLKPQVNIPCRVANALLTVRYVNAQGEVDATDFDDYFTSYSARVSVENAFVWLAPGTQSAYFRAGSSPKVTFRGTLRDTGDEVLYDIPSDRIPTDIDAAQHVILKMQMEKTTAGVTFQVEKAEVETVTITHLMPLEWMPAPKIGPMAEDQLVFETTQQSASASFPFTISSPLQEAELTLNLEDPNFVHLNGTYLLSELTEEKRLELTEAGIVMPVIGQAPEAMDALHFEVLASKLRTFNDAMTSNTFSLRIKANNRWSGDTAVSTTLRIARPSFTLPSLAECDVWSQTIFFQAITAAQIEGGGVPVEDVLPLIQYEVSEDDGETWNVVETTTDGDMLRAGGLKSNQPYLLRASLQGTLLTSDNAETFQTEEQAAVPNGDFEQLTQKIKLEDMNLGGQYRVMWVHMQPKLNATISEPNGWATINHITCDLTSETLNSWFVVPSTFNSNNGATYWSKDVDAGTSLAPSGEADRFKGYAAQNGDVAMVLQNVAWSKNGKVPSESGGTFNTTYYCTNKPSSISNRSAGELFLRDAEGEGNAFTSRPTKLQFWYKYENLKDAEEKGVATIELLSGSTVIASGEAKLDKQEKTYGQATIALTYADTSLKANRLHIKFKSSDATTIQTEDRTSHYQCSTGATLSVDNLTFVYER